MLPLWALAGDGALATFGHKHPKSSRCWKRNFQRNRQEQLCGADRRYSMLGGVSRVAQSSLIRVIPSWLVHSLEVLIIQGIE